MRYPYYLVPDRFKPSIATMRLWLYTRKSQTATGGGCFETDKYSVDLNWFRIAFVIELLAFIFTIYGGILNATIGVKPKISIAIIAIIGSLIFIVFDYVGVLIHHAGVDKRNIARSKLNFEHNPIIVDLLKKEGYPVITTYQIIGFLFFLSSAALKILGLIYLLIFLRKIALVVIFFYLIVVYIHAKHTGYFYSAWRCRRRMNKEYNEFQLDIVANRASQYSVEGLPPFSLTFASHGILGSSRLLLNDRVSIALLNETDSIYNYVLTCKGYLWDEDLSSVYATLPINIQRDVYEACVKMQHMQLGQTSLASPLPSPSNAPIPNNNIVIEDNFNDVSNAQ